MRVSGFTFVRNAIKLYYPVVESIRSILPICDEFIVALGDSEDGTEELIRSIDSDKINIIKTHWDSKYFVKGAINAQQTNIALGHCTGDWGFYLQADEVVHEKYLPSIKGKMEEHFDNTRVEGLLFGFKHFYGDYEHYQVSHGWYSHEIRVIRNKIGVSSWRSAQSFRKNGRKLKVAKADAEIYHYGWVKPPEKMVQKQIAFNTIHKGREWNRQKTRTNDFKYGPLKHLAKFKGTHPKVMQKRISQKNWRVEEDPKSNAKHNRLWIRLLSFLENKVIKKRVGECKNYVLIKER